jgi:hypothetical protein
MVQLVLGASALIVVVLVVSRRQQREFERRFPPISDEEFMARCAPGTRPEVALKVRRIVAEQMGVEYERVDPSTHFVNDLGAD